MATYAAYRHIELDKVGYSKKRVRNPPSDIFNVMCSPNSPNGNGHTPRRNSNNNDSFNRLFGSPENRITPRRASLTKQDVKNRNPVTGNGVDSFDYRPPSRNTPKMRIERNPVTGESYQIISPASTPTKPPMNGFHQQNGFSTPSTPNGNVESPKMNGHA